LREEILPALGFRNIFLKAGVEADDLIASLVMANKDLFWMIISTDDDLLQLLDRNVYIYNLKSKRIVTPKSFATEYGVSPSLWHYVKAIAGCVSDNVKGVSGVGVKTAIRYLNGQLRGIKKDKIEESKEIVNRNLKLVKLPYNDKILDLQLDFEEEFSLDNFIEICQKYDFRSFLFKKDEFESWKQFLLGNQKGG
jgi:DNA polymerase-1